jgi:hypothetical protein
VDGTLPAGARHDLTNKQWVIFASQLVALLAVGKRPGRPRRWALLPLRFSRQHSRSVFRPDASALVTGEAEM